MRRYAILAAFVLLVAVVASAQQGTIPVGPAVTGPSQAGAAPSTVPLPLDTWNGGTGSSNPLGVQSGLGITVAGTFPDQILQLLSVPTALVNVKDSIWSGGAKGDGSTDDLAAIQAAITAICAAPTINELYIPPGNYHLSASPTGCASLAVSAASKGVAYLDKTITAYQAPAVNATKLQGRAIATASPTAGNILGYNGSAWGPTAAPTSAPGASTTPGGSTGQLQYNNSGVFGGYGVGSGLSVSGGDLVATGGSGDATSLQSVPIATATPVNGQVLGYNGAAWTPTKGAPNDLSFTNNTSTFHFTAPVFVIGDIRSYSNVDTTAPVDTSAGNTGTSSSTYSAATITPSVTGDMEVVMYSGWATVIAGPPAGFGHIQNAYRAAGIYNSDWMGDKLLSGTSATGSIDATGVTSDFAGFAALNLALKPVVGQTITSTGTGTANGGVGGSSSIALTDPVGSSVGDVEIACLSYTNEGSPLTPPEGWTVTGSPVNNFANDQNIVCYTRTVGAPSTVHLGNLPVTGQPMGIDASGDITSLPATTFDVTRFGAKCDGITDDSAAFTSAISAAAAACTGVGAYKKSLGMIQLPTAKTCKLNSGITWDGNCVGYEGNGSTLDLTGLSTSGVAVTINTAPDDYTAAPIRDLAMLGPDGYSGTSVGVAVQGNHLNFYNLNIEGFDHDLSFGNNAYVDNFFSPSLSQSTYPVYDGGGSNAGEGLDFFGGTIFNSYYGIYNSGGGMFEVNQTHIDGQGGTILYNRNGGYIHCMGCYVEEFNLIAGYVFDNSGTNSFTHISWDGGSIGNDNGVNPNVTALISNVSTSAVNNPPYVEVNNAVLKTWNPSATCDSGVGTFCAVGNAANQYGIQMANDSDFIFGRAINSMNNGGYPWTIQYLPACNANESGTVLDVQNNASACVPGAAPVGNFLLGSGWRCKIICDSLADGTFNWTILNSSAPGSGGGSGNATSIQSVPVATATPTSGNFLGYNGSSWGPTAAPTSGAPGGVGGQLQYNNSGAFGGLNVGSGLSVSLGALVATGGAGNATSLQAVPIATATPASGTFLGYNGSAWAPTSAPSGSGVVVVPHTLSGTTPTLSCDSFGVISHNVETLTGNTTFTLPAAAAACSLVDGTELRLLVTQAATPHTVSFLAGAATTLHIEVPGGSFPAMPTGPGNTQTYVFIYDVGNAIWHGYVAGSYPAATASVPLGSDLVGSGLPDDLNFNYIGTPGASQKLARNCVRAINFPANFATPTSRASCGTNPSGTETFTVKNITTAATLGTVVLSGSCVPTFATTSGAAQACAAGDRLEIDAPGTPSGADIAITLTGTR